MMLAKLDFKLQKNEILFTSFILYKNQLKIDQRPLFKPETLKILKENARDPLLRYWGRQVLLK